MPCNVAFERPSSIKVAQITVTFRMSWMLMSIDSRRAG
jgi:hypothetical protein